MEETFFRFYLGGIDFLELLLVFYFYIKGMGKRTKVSHCIFFAALGLLWISLFEYSMVIKLSGIILLLLFFGLSVYKAEYKACLLYGILLVELSMLCHGITNALTGILSPYLYSGFSKNFPNMVMIVMSPLAVCLIFLCYFTLCRYFIPAEPDKNQYLLMILTPLLLIFFVSEYINDKIYGNTVVLDNQGVMLNANHMQMLGIELLGICSIFIIISAYKKLLQSFYLGTRLSMLKQETHFQRQYVEEARLRYDKTKAFRHDMKNHISVLKGLLDSGCTSGAAKYIQGLDAMNTQLSFPCHTNHPVLDILIGNKLGLAQDLGIEVSCTLKIPSESRVEDIDYCIILSNALDNAIHGCEELSKDQKKYICILGHQQGDFLLLEVENNYLEKGVIKKGIGISNIKAVAEKYNGTVNISYKGQVFSLCVLLNLG